MAAAETMSVALIARTDQVVLFRGFMIFWFWLGSGWRDSSRPLPGGVARRLGGGTSEQNDAALHADQFDLKYERGVRPDVAARRVRRRRVRPGRRAADFAPLFIIGSDSLHPLMTSLTPKVTGSPRL